MGGIMRGLFGGSKNKSGNHAYGAVQQATAPGMALGNNAMSVLGGMLGVGGGDVSNSSGFKNYLDNSGYDFIKKEGLGAIEGSRAAKGGLYSGATGKAMTSYGENLAKTFLGDYMDRLTSLGQYGQNNLNTLASAGQYSKGTSQNGAIPTLFPGGIGSAG